MARKSRNLILLARQYASAQEQFAELLKGILLNKSKRQRTSLQIKAVALIHGLRRASDAWLDQTLTIGIRRYDREAIEALQAIGINTEDGSNKTLGSVRAVFKSAGSRYFDRISAGMFTLLASVTAVKEDTLAVAFPDIVAKVKSEDPLLSDAFFEEGLKEKILAKLTERIESKQVIIGVGPATRRYSMQYYATLVGHSIETSLPSAIHASRAREFGWDLVQVETTDAAHEDFCAAYRGKVVSLTGATEGYELITRLPNAGPPFHPWCRHRIKIFNPATVTEDKLSKLRSIPEQMLLSGPDDTIGRIQKDWKAAK